MVKYDRLEEKLEVLRLLDDGLTQKEITDQLGVPRITINAYSQGFNSVVEYEDHLAKQRTNPETGQPFKSHGEYIDYLAKQRTNPETGQPFKSHGEYRSYKVKHKGPKSRARGTNLKRISAILKKVSIGKRYGEDALQRIVEEYDLFSTEVGLRGRASLTVLAVATYGVLRKRNDPITLDDIADLFNVSRKSVIRNFRDFYSVVNGIPLQDAKLYIKRGVDELGLSEKVEKNALDFFEKNRDILRNSKPSASAAVCIYVQAKISGEKRLQREVADSLKVTDATIRNIMRVLENNKRL